MLLETHLILIQTRGLTAEAAHALARGFALNGERGLARALETEDGRGRLLRRLQAAGLQREQAVAWPPLTSVRRLAELLGRAGAWVAWRGEADYPARLQEGLGEGSPAWVWVAGRAERLAAPACAVIGSRQTAPPFLEAARRLGRALADSGVAVVSGLAAGADSAAHEGARAGAAGTVAIPASGLLTAGLPVRLGPPGARDGQQTWLGLDRPDAPFSAGLAIRRNDVIAALGDALVLVASGLKGGSAYGVRWALRHGVPLFCFESGSATPPANRSLIQSGAAQALELKAPAEAWMEKILPEIEKRRRGDGRARRQAAAPQQLDWLGAR